MHKHDAFALLAAVVGFSSLATDAAFSSQLSLLFGANAKVGLAVLGLLGTVAAQIIRIYSNPTIDPVPVAAPSVHEAAPTTIENTTTLSGE